MKKQKDHLAGRSFCFLGEGKGWGGTPVAAANRLWGGASWGCGKDGRRSRSGREQHKERQWRLSGPSSRVALAVSSLKQMDELRSTPDEARTGLANPDRLTTMQDTPMLVPEVDMLRKTNDIVMTVTGLLLPPVLIAAFGVMFWQLFFR